MKSSRQSKARASPKYYFLFFHILPKHLQKHESNSITEKTALPLLRTTARYFLFVVKITCQRKSDCIIGNLEKKWYTV